MFIRNSGSFQCIRINKLKRSASKINSKRSTKKAIAKRYGTDYRVGSIAEAIYLASGSSIDWVYATQNVNLTYTFEFRDKGKHIVIIINI